MANPRTRWRPTPAWLADRAASHLSRIRREGLARVASADARRARALAARYRWRVTHDFRPNAVPVFVVGIQRSGTDMLMFAFKECPEVEVHNEAEDTRAFFGFALRSDPVIRRLVESSRHKIVLFKSLLDAHRIDHLMTGLGTPSRGKSIWIYRSMEGRVRSTLARWPENNRRVLRAIAEGRGGDHWEAQGLSDGHLELVKNLDHDRLSPASAAAALWYLRNSLFFDLGFDRREDVALTSYERFLEDPARHMRLLCDFLDVSYTPRMTSDIAPRPPAIPDRLEIDEDIQSLCDELRSRLERELDRRLELRAPAGPA
jgi:hypothetical protein